MLLFINILLLGLLTSEECDCDWNAIVTSDNAFFGQKTENNVKVKGNVSYKILFIPFKKTYKK